MPLYVQPFQPVVSPTPGAIAGWMSSTNPSLPHAAMAAGSPGLVQPSSAGEDACNVSKRFQISTSIITCSIWL